MKWMYSPQWAQQWGKKKKTRLKNNFQLDDPKLAICGKDYIFKNDFNDQFYLLVFAAFRFSFVQLSVNWATLWKVKCAGLALYCMYNHVSTSHESLIFLSSLSLYRLVLLCTTRRAPASSKTWWPKPIRTAWRSRCPSTSSPLRSLTRKPPPVLRPSLLASPPAGWWEEDLNWCTQTFTVI